MSQQPPLSARASLSTASRHLAHAAPDEWRAFKVAFEAYRQWLADGVTDADAANIMTAKGTALGARALTQLFNECEGSPQ